MIRKLAYLSFSLVVLLFLSCKSNHTPGNLEKTNVSVIDTFQAKTPTSPVRPIDYDTSQWVEFTSEDLVLDIRYATEHNFMQQQVYPCGRCFLKKNIATHFKKVIAEATKLGYQIVAFDCYRPKSIQQKLWEIKPDARFVTPPSKGSMHNRGAAIDLSLMKDGKLVNMGTEYDHFGHEAYPDNTDIDSTAYANRQLLKGLMEKHGFSGIRTEWWHFSLKNKAGQIADWNWFCER